MKTGIQLITLSLTLCAGVVAIGTGCQGTTSSSDSAGAPRDPSMMDRSSSNRMNQSMADSANADNSRKNVRDRSDATLTPGDQGSTEVDRDITRQIRKALVSGDNNYSVTAQNIKIITANGKVTLRGPANNSAEKNAIALAAKNVAGNENVDDQLEVKANPNP